jgi:hypothetical protein
VERVEGMRVVGQAVGFVACLFQAIEGDEPRTARG